MISCVILTHNRLTSLQRCIRSIIANTTVPYEIIVVDNASNDGTTEWLTSLPLYPEGKLLVIKNSKNEGVCSRNRGFEMAQFPYVAQIDDDVTMLSNWDTASLKYFDDDKVGLIGQQGGLVNGWLNLEVYKHNNSYVDFVTGYYMMMKRVGIYYDLRFDPFWHEELHLSFQFKEQGYKLRMIKEPVCVHLSERRDVDWEIHDRNLHYVYDQWKENSEILRLGGN